MQLTVTHKGRSHVVETSGDAALGELKARVSDLTDIPPDLQKLLPGRGKVSPAKLGTSADPESTLASLGVVDGQKIMVLGTTYAQLDQLNAQELAAAAERRRRAHPSMLRPTKVRASCPIYVHYYVAR